MEELLNGLVEETNKEFEVIQMERDKVFDNISARHSMLRKPKLENIEPLNNINSEINNDDDKIMNGLDKISKELDDLLSSL